MLLLGEDVVSLFTAAIITAAFIHGHAETHHQHSLGVLHSIVVLLAHSPHDGILLALLGPSQPPLIAFRHTRITAQPPSSAVAQTLPSLDSHARASGRTALASRRTVRRAVSRELDGLVAIGEGAELALGAVGDADPALDDAIVAALVSTFATDAFRFSPTGGGGGGGGAIVHTVWVGANTRSWLGRSGRCKIISRSVKEKDQPWRQKDKEMID